MDVEEPGEEHQEVVGEVEVSYLPSKPQPRNLHCTLQCDLLGKVGRFSETTNSL